MKQLIKKTLARLGAQMLQPNLDHPDPRTAPAAKVAMRNMFFQLRAQARAGAPLPSIADSGFRVFSQFEEDGYLLYLAAVLDLSPKLFIDIGSNDGIYSNCANLALNLGWHGLFIDGSEEAIAKGRKFYAKHSDTWLYPPVFSHAFITRENINDLISKAGFNGKVGIVSIDIDGNDCWVWEALTVVEPAVVIIETQTEFGDRNVAVPYDADYFYPGKHPEYHGASPRAMVSLARKKGYRLVGANRFGFNTIYVRNGIGEDLIPEVSLESVLTHPRYFERLALADPIKDWKYVEL